LSYVDIFQIVFLIIVFAIGFIGFMRAATSDDKDDDKKDN